MDFFIVLGAVSSIATLVNLFLPATKNRERMIHAGYVLAIALLTGITVHYQQQYSRIEQAKRFAASLLNTDSQYSTQGFSMAALAFLETNKDIFPDTYSRAQQLCKANDCTGAQYGNPNRAAVDFEYNQNNVASALRGLVRGIASRSSP